MDELIEDFLVETREGLESLDNDLVTLEQNPADKEIISKIFRIMHTIKGTCGFLGLSRLESIAHAGEDIFDNIRDGKLSVTPHIISLVFESLDKIRGLVDHIESNEKEPDGNDKDLIDKLHAAAEGHAAPAAAPAPVAAPAPAAAPVQAAVVADPVSADSTDLQALFDATPSLVDVGQNKPTEAAPAAAPSSDNADLQALFDATPSLVDVGQNKPAEAAPAAAPSSDNADLQALFDATPSLVDVGQFAKAEEAPAAPAEVAPPPAPAEQPAAKAPAEHDNKEKKAASSAAQTIRVSLDVLESLMQQASELVLTRNQLMQILRSTTDSEFTSALQRLSVITTDLQEGVMKTRMQPVGNAWTKLPRIVRDLSVELGKKIDLIMKGEETELDRQLLERITDPLTHMVRNSADHGLETPEKRVAAGKSETGKIELTAYHGGGYIIIEISDDGNGINPEIIKKKAIEKGLVSESDAAGMSDSQIFRFIFAAGFSTAEKITSVSGRGVGMDVVKTNIESISGTVDLKSTLGKGSTFTIKIPLTLAIMPILQVAVSNHKFAIPQINVMEIVKANSSSGFMIETISDRPVLRLRERLLPLVVLSEILGLGACDFSDNTKPKFIVVCEAGSYHFGVIVEEVFDTEEIVVKPVPPILKNISVYSGSTILGDGSVILILDPNGMAKEVGDVQSNNVAKQEDENALKNTEYSSFIVFRSGDATPKVVPLELVSRLEEIEVANIEYSRGAPIIQYRNDLMRLAQIDPNYKIPEEGVQQLLVSSRSGKTMGLVVEEILDIARCPINNNLSSNKSGFLGSMVINGKTCDVIDVGYYFDQVFKGETDDTSVDASKKTILLVDDSPFFRKFIPLELKSAGYNVIAFSSAKEALVKLESDDKIAAVITDIHMPVMDGNEFTNICRANPKLQHVPFIALSSQVDGDAGVNIALTATFDAKVSKTDHKELSGVLASLLAKESAL